LKVGGDWHTGYSATVPAGVDLDTIRWIPPRHALVRTAIEAVNKIGSIYIPKAFQKQLQHLSTLGVVVRTNWPDDETPWFVEGDPVLYGKYTGAEIDFTDDPGHHYRLVTPENIFFVFHRPEEDPDGES
jgi:hypothetical protein